MARGEAHLGLDWSPSPVVLVRLHATARTEPGAAGGWRAGLAEAFLQYRPELRPSLALRLRAGLLFPPTSRENVDPFWQSPYTLTLSSVNTWIGEEVRLAGLDVAAQLGAPGGGRLELAAMAFGGSDTAGALLAWRGWAHGTRLSVAGRRCPCRLSPPSPPAARSPTSATTARGRWTSSTGGSAGTPGPGGRATASASSRPRGPTTAATAPCTAGSTPGTRDSRRSAPRRRPEPSASSPRARSETPGWVPPAARAST